MIPTHHPLVGILGLARLMDLEPGLLSKGEVAACLVGKFGFESVRDHDEQLMPCILLHIAQQYTPYFTLAVLPRVLRDETIHALVQKDWKRRILRLPLPQVGIVRRE